MRRYFFAPVHSRLGVGCFGTGCLLAGAGNGWWPAAFVGAFVAQIIAAEFVKETDR